MARPTVSFVDLAILRQNLINIKSSTNAKVMMLVKANAYGHGAVECAKQAEKVGIDYLGVATIEEGIELRQNGIKLPILSLGPIPIGSEEDCILADIEQAVGSKEEVERLSYFTQKNKKTLGIHIKIETGMHRTGVRTGEDLEELLNTIKQNEYIRIKGMFTHFAQSDTFDKAYTDMQVKEFKKAIEQIKNSVGDCGIIHASNSGGILSYPEYKFDMVRAGITCYGYYPSHQTKKTIELKPVLSLKTAIVAINKLKKGESVSYGSRFTAQKDMLVAVLPIGYGDGYKRLLSNRGEVVLNGKRAKILGTVCMDMTMIDVTDIPANVGDEVILLGNDGKLSITADELAEISQTISYEILLSFTSRIPKVYLNE